MIVQLIVQLDINERVQDALPCTTDRREAETNAKIVDLLAAAMFETKKLLCFCQYITLFFLKIYEFFLKKIKKK